MSLNRPFPLRRGEGEEEDSSSLELKTERRQQWQSFIAGLEENCDTEDEDDVEEQVKQDRVNAIMEAQSEISLENNQKYVNSIHRVLIDRKEGPYYVARTEFDSPDVDNEVLIDARDTYSRVGDFANVRITEAKEYDLFAEFVK